MSDNKVNNNIDFKQANKLSKEIIDMLKAHVLKQFGCERENDIDIKQFDEKKFNVEKFSKNCNNIWLFTYNDSSLGETKVKIIMYPSMPEVIKTEILAIKSSSIAILLKPQKTVVLVADGKTTYKINIYHSFSSVTVEINCQENTNTGLITHNVNNLKGVIETILNKQVPT